MRIEEEFPRGMRVRLVQIDHPEGPQLGWLGTVMCYWSTFLAGVEWDDEFERGHNLDGAARDRRGWWCLQHQIAPIWNEPRVWNGRAMDDDEAALYDRTEEAP